MQILEHGQAQERTLLFFPCTAEPVWAFADTITLLSQRWHVFQVVYDGHQPEYPGDFTSVEQTVDVTGLVDHEGDYVTVAGLLLEHFGCMPKTGDTIVIRGLVFEVLQLERNRIASVRITKPLPANEPAE